jgi:ankyrin repeat protein
MFHLIPTGVIQGELMRALPLADALRLSATCRAMRALWTPYAYASCMVGNEGRRHALRAGLESEAVNDVAPSWRADFVRAALALGASASASASASNDASGSDDDDEDARHRHASALHTAALKGYASAIAALLEASDRSAQLAASQQTYASDWFLSGMFAWYASGLAAAGTPPCKRTRRRSGYTALMLAAWYGHVDCLAALLAHDASAQLAAKSLYGHTPLMLAAMTGKADCCAALLAAPNVPEADRAAQLTAKSLHGHTALMLAAWYGHAACLPVLLRGGLPAPTGRGDREETNIRDRGETEMRGDGGDEGREDGSLSDAQLAATADNGYTALMFAARAGNAACVGSLLASAASAASQLVATSADGTALMIAARWGHGGCVLALYRAAGRTGVPGKSGVPAMTMR